LHYGNRKIDFINSIEVEETFDVGEDTGSLVIEDVYAVPFKCASLQKLTVLVGE